ncbi:MAG: phenylalanine--tRNA ligase subunit alpha [Bdellovibrionaceae bacterium]|nr:phenylalanine--tRNA ligase subunit alpha [Pseudobdellovibrionaceae bacterium]
MLVEKANQIYEEAKAAIKSAPDSKTLYNVKVNFLGKQGQLSALMREMVQLPKEERPEFGKLVNEKKQNLENHYESREQELKKLELQQLIENEKLDLTLPGPDRDLGKIHPIAKVIDDISSILNFLGYSVQTGPLIEKDWFNFEALNIPQDHPARDEQDTFYIDETHVLRTHTSPVQIHTMLKQSPPFRAIAPGPVFRCDSDVSHSPNFHQIEALLIDKNVSMADLKGTIAFFVREFFGPEIKTRFRPSFFPFTEPSAEVDCSCPICKGKGCRMCKNSGWIEIGGSGLVNPKVLEQANIDPKEWQGFAFGFGIERMAIIKYGVPDIRLFSDNDIRFLSQF